MPKKTIRLDAFTNEEDGKFVVRQGSAPFEVVGSHDTMADANAEVEKLHAENNPDPASRGAEAKKNYEAFVSEKAKADGMKADLDTERTDSASVKRERDQLKARFDAKDGDAGLTEEVVARRVKDAVDTEITARIDSAAKAWPMLKPEDRDGAKLLKLSSQAIKTKAIQTIRPNQRLDGQSPVYVDTFFDTLAGKYAASDEHLGDLFSAVKDAESTKREDQAGNGNPDPIAEARKSKYENLGKRS